MRERPLLYFALGVLLTTSIGAVSLREDGIEFPDGSVQSSADTRKAFYLTDSSFWVGGNALVACDADAGFHMASLWEILDPTELRYARNDDLSEGYFVFRLADSGAGPPAGVQGWVRTGFLSTKESTDGAGKDNCDTWSYSQADGDGSVVELLSCWSNDPGCGIAAGTTVGSAWLPFERQCNQAARVWCVED